MMNHLRTVSASCSYSKHSQIHLTGMVLLLHDAQAQDEYFSHHQSFIGVTRSQSLHSIINSSRKTGITTYCTAHMGSVANKIFAGEVNFLECRFFTFLVTWEATRVDDFQSIAFKSRQSCCEIHLVYHNTYPKFRITSSSPEEIKRVSTHFFSPGEVR